MKMRGHSRASTPSRNRREQLRVNMGIMATSISSPELSIDEDYIAHGVTQVPPPPGFALTDSALFQGRPRESAMDLTGDGFGVGSMPVGAYEPVRSTAHTDDLFVGNSGSEVERLLEENEAKLQKANKLIDEVLRTDEQIEAKLRRFAFTQQFHSSTRLELQRLRKRSNQTSISFPPISPFQGNSRRHPLRAGQRCEDGGRTGSALPAGSGAQ